MEQKLLQFVQKAMLDRNNDKTIFEFDLPSITETNHLFVLSGLNLLDYRRILDSFAVRHIFKNHGNETAETDRGQIAVSMEDFILIPTIINQFETFSVETNRIGNTMFRYTMETDDFRLIFAEEVRTGRKELAAQTLYKQKIRKP